MNRLSSIFNNTHMVYIRKATRDDARAIWDLRNTAMFYRRFDDYQLITVIASNGRDDIRSGFATK